MNWEIETNGEAREVYAVEAETEKEAKQRFLDGEGSLIISEVSGTIVESSIQQITPEGGILS